MVGQYLTQLKCRRYVIHTAAPVIMSCPQRLAFSKIVWPTVRGMENVLAAVNKADSVERVVVTSSIAAVVGDWEGRGKGHVFTEEDWTLNFSPEFAYGMCAALPGGGFCWRWRGREAGGHTHREFHSGCGSLWWTGGALVVQCIPDGPKLRLTTSRVGL